MSRSALLRRVVRSASLPAAALCALTLAGCHVNTDKNGDHKNVDIGTPFGSMHVKTDNAGASSAGLAAYPGATPVKDSDGDHSSADVNMSFGSFHLGVKASSYLTPDSPDKVLAFYRKDLESKFGPAIECRDHAPVGQPERTPDGLTCKDDNDSNHHKGFRWDNGKSHVDTDSAEHQLRAGSKTHQHIVAVNDHDGGGTKMTLLALDLPGGNDTKDSD